MSTIVSRRWVILRDRGCAPEKKGNFRTDAHLIGFVREAVRVRAADTQITVAQLTWNHDLWVQDGREMIAIADALAESPV